MSDEFLATGAGGADEQATSPEPGLLGAGLVTLTPRYVTLDPVTRIEGHLKIKVKLDTVDGRLQVVDAWSTGTMFRGIESILVGREPWDAVPITQRICGVCPVSHGLAATLAIEAAKGVTPPNNARILRNLVLGANYLQSHILHFYHLAALDYVQGPEMAPWQPQWTADLRLDPDTSAILVQHYLAALTMRRKAHEMGAVFGGRMPHPPAFIPGGFTCTVNSERRNVFASYLNEIVAFVQDTYIPDVVLLGTAYADFYDIGAGPRNLLSYGVFDLNAQGTLKLLAPGRATNGAHVVQTVSLNQIAEHVTASWYAQSTNRLHPANGQTLPQFPKTGAYSWLKAPRYAGLPYEAGPLARMWVNGDYRDGISVMDRHLARAYETLKVAQAMQGWLGELATGGSVFTVNTQPTSGTAFGLTEAPRGALGHWVQIAGGAITRYQVLTPTCWNASPRDSRQIRGPIEHALIGTPISNEQEPIEVLRVIHSFDPCLSCAVHVIRDDGRGEVVVPA